MRKKSILIFHIWGPVFRASNTTQRRHLHVFSTPAGGFGNVWRFPNESTSQNYIVFKELVFQSHEARAIRRTTWDGCGVEEGACGVDGSLEVFRQPSIAPDPREEPLDDPTPRVDSEADLIGVCVCISTAITCAATFSPAYPLSAKTRWMNGKVTARFAEVVRHHRDLGYPPDAVRARGRAQVCDPPAATVRDEGSVKVGVSASPSVSDALATKTFGLPPLSR